MTTETYIIANIGDSNETRLIMPRGMKPEQIEELAESMVNLDIITKNYSIIQEITSN